MGSIASINKIEIEFLCTSKGCSQLVEIIKDDLDQSCYESITVFNLEKVKLLFYVLKIFVSKI
jgi:hypothetical protein